jgi:hypothetical protein
MKKLMILLVLFSCKKKDTQPHEPEPPTPAPTYYYKLTASVKTAAYTQTASPFGATDSKDSTYIDLKAGLRSVGTKSVSNLTINVVTVLDSVKTGEKITLNLKMLTYTKNAKECKFQVNKVWLTRTDNVETTLSGAVTSTVPVVYSFTPDTLGQASRVWEFSVP